jgi:ATP-binding cassette subfamily B protein
VSGDGDRGESRNGDKARLRPMGWEPYKGPRSLRRMPGLLFGAVRLLWEAAPGLTLLFLGLQLVSAAAAGASLLVVRSLATELLAADRAHSGFGSITVPLIVLAAIVALIGFMGAVRQSITMVLQERVGWIAWERILDVAGAVDLEAFDRSDFHDRLQRAQTGGQRPFQITNSLLSMTGSITTLVSVVAVLILLQPLLIPTLLLTVVPLVFAASAFSRDFYRFSATFVHSDRRRFYLRGLMVERNMAKEVRAFNLVDFLRRRNRQLFDERMREQTRLAQRGSVRSLLASVGTAAATVATVAVLLWFVLTGRMTLAAATAAAVAIVQLGGTLASMAFAAGQLYEGSLFLEDHRAFHEMLPRVQEARPTGAAPTGFQAIHVEHVGFTYPEADRPALEDVSLTIRRGEIVALVGENGSGKTTLAKLLCQLYRPQQGVIRWDGFDLAGVDPDALRESIAVVFQDFAQYLFDAASNIGMGRVARLGDRPGIERASREAGAHDFLNDLPDGYDTMLGKIFEGGVDLSVGQWQRIALARAFFRDAPLVILDEPTAALDARREHELFASMRALLRGRTVLLISHRFSSVLNADRIYVLKDGRIVEQGNHADLMRKNGLYAELFTLQAAAYLDGAQSEVV